MIMSRKTIYGIISAIGVTVVIGTAVYLIRTFDALDEMLEAETRKIEFPPIQIMVTDTLDYEFPLDTTTYLTSTFGEFRPTHHHGGIDLGTNNETGIPVRASRSGFVKKIVLSPFGYGKVLYLQHPDSFITVYAHLENFEPVINKFVRDIQLSTFIQSVEHTFNSDSFFYRKGDIIGFTGKSGSGSPHMHFEIREPNGNRINPLIFPNIRKAIIDTIPPSFERVKLVPVDQKSRIDFDINEKVLFDKAAKKAVQAYTHLNGRAGVLVKISDRSQINRTGDHGIKKITMSLNDQSNVFYTLDFNVIDHKRYKEIFFTRDHFEFYFNGQVFYKLFDEYGIGLSSMPSTSDGILDSKTLGNGMNTVYLTAYDNLDNSSSLVFGLYTKDDIPTVEWSINATHIDIRSSLPISKFSYSFYDRKGRQIESDEMKNLYTKEIKLTNRKFERLQVKITNHGFENPQSVFISPNGSQEIKVENVNLKFYYNSYLLQLNSKNFLDSKSEIVIEANGNEYFYPVFNFGNNIYASLIEINPNIYGEVYFYLKNNPQKIPLLKGNFIFFEGDSLSIKTYDDKFLIKIPADAFYQPLFMKVGYEKDEIFFYPKNILIKSAINIESKEPTRKNIRFGINQKNEWNDIPTQSYEGSLFGQIYQNLGDIKKMLDESPPEVLDWHIVKKGVFKTSMGNYSVSADKQIFVFKVREIGFGLDYSSTEVFLNGNRILAEYEPDISSYYVFLENLLGRNRNKLFIQLKDNGGNFTERTIQF
jgi:hypothetical protein